MSLSQINTKIIRTIVKQNRAWNRSVKNVNPEFFKIQANKQVPYALAIGCSDSRVPMTQICDAAPGDFFTTRNVANIVSPNDKSLSMVLDYGLHHLKIPNVIVFGHYNCGGVALAMQQAESKSQTDIRNPAEEWVDPIVKMIRDNNDILSKIEDKYRRYDRVCELHCGFTCRAISEHPVARSLFEAGNLCIYGIMYDPARGKLSRDGYALHKSNKDVFDPTFMNVTW